MGFCAGDYARIVVQFLQMGPVRFITMPGEFSPEMVIGVPTDFDTPEGVAKYFQRADVHLTGADFTLPGLARPASTHPPSRGLLTTILQGGSRLRRVGHVLRHHL